MASHDADVATVEAGSGSRVTHNRTHNRRRLLGRSRLRGRSGGVRGGAPWTVLLYVCSILVGFTTLFPLLWMLSASFKSENDVLRRPFGLLPSTIEWRNYVDAFSAVRPYLWNSIKLAIYNVVGVLAVSSLAGYAFGRLQFIGRDLLFGIVLATTMVPGIAYLVPQYIMFDSWGWVDTHFPLWMPRVMTPAFGTFLMRQAFKALPAEVEEAARVDGAGVFRIYLQIMLPLTGPALAAIGVLTFVESWNDLFGPLIFINSTNLQTLPVALALFKGEFFTQINLLMAAATISVIPVLVVYFLGQRHLVQGVATTGTTA